MKHIRVHRRQRAKGGQRPSPKVHTHVRAGTTLVEIVVVVSISAVLLSSAIVAIGVLLKAERGAAGHIWYGATLTRLSRTLRSDVHAAQNARLVPADATHGLLLELAGTQGKNTTYEVAGATITRVVKKPAQPDKRDAFRLPESSVITFEAGSSPARVKLTIGISGSDRAPATVDRSVRAADASSRRTLAVEALVARDFRLSAVRP